SSRISEEPVGRETMQRTEIPSFESGILARLMVGAKKPSMSRVAARVILTLEFGEADKERMHALVAKARADELNSEELHEVEAYSRVSSLIGILKSKARRVLKRGQINGKPSRQRIDCAGYWQAP